MLSVYSPEIKRLLSGWQSALREKTGNDTLLIVAVGKEIGPISLDEISKMVCEVTAIPFKLIHNQNRRLEVVIARQLICYYAWQAGHPLRKIGLYIGGKDHSTVIHSRDRMKELIENGDKKALRFVKQIEEIISPKS